ncbi:MAG TPA: glycosyltransferase [Candidatus Obscuribacterales bacterium]
MAKDYRYLLQDLQRAEDRSKPKLNPDQNLSLCMIARNEEHYIGDALKSVQGLVDEIIVVDTGSSDRTVEIAKEHGAKVFFTEWQNDFAAARNEALRHASGDWILILDADERVPEDLKDNLRSLLIPTDQAISYLLYIRNYLREGDESSVLGHYMVRLFRKTPETRFFGMIHEQLYPNWGEVTIPENSFYINHLGYSKQEKKLLKIENRNLPMIQKALEETRGKNPSLYSFYAFYMGSSLQKVDEVRKWLKESIDSCPDPQKSAHIPVAYIDYMRAIYYAHDFEEGIRVGQQALTHVPEIESYPDFWDFYGVLYLANRQYDLAISSFEKALQLMQAKSTQAMFFASHTSRIGGWGTLMNLGLAYALKGEQARAQDYFHQAITAYPSEDKTPVASRIDEIMGNPQLTQSYFEERIKLDERNDYDLKVLSNIYLKQEKPFEAIMLQHELHGYEKAVETALRLAGTYDQHQRPDLAIKAYEGVLSLVPEYFQARLGKFGAELHQQQKTPTAEELEALVQAAQTPADQQALGEFCLRFGQLEAATAAFASILAQDPDNYDANLYLALVEQESQQPEAAQQRLKQLISHAPDQAPAYTQLGNLDLFMGQFSDAEAQFRRVLGLLPAPDWYSHYGLGVALAGQERFDEAEAELGQSLKLAPGHAAPTNLLALIDQARQAASQV